MTKKFKSIKKRKETKNKTQIIIFSNDYKNLCFLIRRNIQNEEGIRLNNKLIFIQIYIPNLRKKCYNLGRESLKEEERYLLALIEKDIELSKELGEGDKVMEEYAKEAEEVSKEEFFGESYDKEWALRDEMRREGKEEGYKEGKEKKQKEIARAMIKDNIDVAIISKYTGLTKEEIEDINKK